jgi:DNA methylase.
LNPFENSIEVLPNWDDGFEGCWTWGKPKAESEVAFLTGKKVNGNWKIYVKEYANGASKMLKTILVDKSYYTEKGQKSFNTLFKSKGKIFQSPKSPELLSQLLKTSTMADDIILDFFSGSCTTAHAILDLNNEDASTGSAQAGNRKFICVQFPEKCDENSEAFKAGYKTIAEIGKERIRRVIKKIKEEQKGKLDLDGRAGKQDLGFKVFKLQESNFKIWRSRIESEEELVKQLQRHLEPLDENAKTEDVLYELLLKSGIPLTAKIEEKNGYILVNDKEIALLLEKVDEKIVKKVIADKPRKVITLDRLFKNNDRLKTNTALQMKDAGIEFKAV